MENKPVLLESPPVAATKRASVAINWRLQILVFSVVFALIVSRRPDALFRPQFYAEDGKFWYADAYNGGGMPCLLWPYAGYLVMLPRLVAGLALLVPLSLAPLVMNVIGLVVQVLPVSFLLSSRGSGWGSLQFRTVLGFAYLALPNTMELHATITEAQWYFAVLLCLVALAPAPTNIAWRIFDCLVIVIGGLTGPFCLLLLPITSVFWFVRRSPWQRTVIALLTVASAIQVIAVWKTAGVARSSTPLGATFDSFVRILAGKVYLGVILGQNAITAFGPLALWVGVTLLGTALVVYCLLKAPLEIKLFVSFAGLAFAACLSNPLLAKRLTGPRWKALEFADGIHYWFLPMLAFVLALLWCVNYGKSRAFRVLAMFVLVFACFGVLKDWEYPAFPDLKFAEYARRFDSAPAGSVVTIPLHPPGWEMRLTKKP